jgi:hypothetical protein
MSPYIQLELLQYTSYVLFFYYFCFFYFDLNVLVKKSAYAIQLLVRFVVVGPSSCVALCFTVVLIVFRTPVVQFRPCYFVLVSLSVLAQHH